MAQKQIMKQKDAPKIGARPLVASKPVKEGGAAVPPVVAPVDPKENAAKRGFWDAWFAKNPPQDTMKENLAAVKSGVLTELEHISAQRGTPVTGSPFSTIVLPPRAKPVRGMKWAVLVLFLGLFVAIMWLAGRHGPMGMHGDVVKTEGVAIAVQAPVSRADVHGVAAPTRGAGTPLPLIKVLSAQKGKATADNMVVTLTLGNAGKVAIPAGPVHLTIADAAGQPLKHATLALEEVLQPGESRKQTWTLPLMPGNRMDGFVATLPLAALTVHVRAGE